MTNNCNQHYIDSPHLENVSTLLYHKTLSNHQDPWQQMESFSLHFHKVGGQVLTTGEIPTYSTRMQKYPIYMTDPAIKSS